LNVSAFFDSRVALWLAPFIGAALALSFAPFGLWPLAVVCPAYLFLAWQHVTPRRAAKLGFWFTGATYLAGTYWIYHSVHDIGHAPAWLAIFLVLGLVAIMGGYCAALGYALARWVAIRSPWGALLALPSAWVLLEWFRGWFLSGFPWLALGYSQSDTALAAFAPIGGVYAISLLVAISAGALVVLVTGTTWARVGALATGAAIWSVSALLWHHHWTESSGAPVTAAIVQGAVPQDLKWSSDPQQTATLYENLTTPHFGKDILLWPESALPVLDFQGQSFFRSVSDRAKAKGSRLVSGLLHYDQKTDSYYNGMVAFDDETQWYFKRRLVPFGEFFPVPSFVRKWLKLMSLPYSDMTPGDRHQPALRVNGQKIGATICYEDAYGVEQLEVLKDATMLINITNDAWFGDSTAAPQHLQISRMRVMEAQRPLLRAANDGISAIINADGHVESVLPRFKPDVLTGSVQPRTGLTPYAHVGNWPVIVFAMLVVLVFAHGAILRLVVRRKDATETDSGPRTGAA
jgi:apolipoprotein N-acyltransferase